MMQYLHKGAGRSAKGNIIEVCQYARDASRGQYMVSRGWHSICSPKISKLLVQAIKLNTETATGNKCNICRRHGLLTTRLTG